MCGHAFPLRKLSETMSTQILCRSSDQSLAATCAKWSRYERGVLVTGWTDGRVSFSEVASCGSSSSAAGGGSGAGFGWGKGENTKLVLPNGDNGGSVVDLRQGKQTSHEL